jgi:CRP-like cAMP-binding protein
MSSSTATENSCRISKDFDILRRTELFSSAPAEIIKLFAYLAKHRIYQPGETILSQGEKADNCYLLLRGEVDVSTLHKGHNIVVQRVQPGSFFGEIALLARFEWFFSATARSEAELLITDRESFQKVLDKYPDKRQQITEKLIQLRISRFENQTSYLLDRLIESGYVSKTNTDPLII